MAFIACMGALVAGKMLVLGFCFGLLVIGFGELIMHPMQQTYIAGYIMEGRPRRANLGGIIVDCAGVVITLFFAAMLAREAGAFG